jgi:hypothetical protein
MLKTFREGFEITLDTIELEDIYDYKKEEYRTEYLDGLSNTLSELGITKEQIEYDKTSTGIGAEGSAILIIITGLIGLFLAGKSINENIDAWLKLGKRFKGVIKKLKKQGQLGEDTALFVSEPVALAIALGEVAKLRPKAADIVLDNSIIEEVPNPSIDTGFQGIFRHNQMRYYIFSFRLLDEGEVHLICLRSTGDVEVHHVLHVGNWMKFSGIDLTGDV